MKKTSGILLCMMLASALLPNVTADHGTFTYGNHQKHVGSATCNPETITLAPPLTQHSITVAGETVGDIDFVVHSHDGHLVITADISNLGLLPCTFGLRLTGNYQAKGINPIGRVFNEVPMTKTIGGGQVDGLTASADWWMACCIVEPTPGYPNSSTIIIRIEFELSVNLLTTKTGYVTFWEPPVGQDDLPQVTIDWPTL